MSLLSHRHGVLCPLQEQLQIISCWAVSSPLSPRHKPKVEWWGGEGVGGAVGEREDLSCHGNNQGDWSGQEGSKKGEVFWTFIVCTCERGEVHM